MPPRMQVRFALDIHLRPRMILSSALDVRYIGFGKDFLVLLYLTEKDREEPRVLAVRQHNPVTLVLVDELKQRPHVWRVTPSQDVRHSNAEFADVEETLGRITEHNQPALCGPVVIEETPHALGVFLELLLLAFVLELPDVPQHVSEYDFEPAIDVYYIGFIRVQIDGQHWAAGLGRAFHQVL